MFLFIIRNFLIGGKTAAAAAAAKNLAGLILVQGNRKRRVKLKNTARGRTFNLYVNWKLRIEPALQIGSVPGGIISRDYEGWFTPGCAASITQI